MNFLKNSKLFYILIIGIAVGTLIAVYNSISFIFEPVKALLNSVFIPVIIAVFIYYIFLPVYRLVLKFVKQEIVAIILIFVLIVGILYFIFASLLPSLLDQIQSLFTMIPNFIENILTFSEELLIEYNISTNQIYNFLEEIGLTLSNMVSLAQNLLARFTSSLGSFLSGTVRFLIALFTFPIVLFFLFKDGNKMSVNITKWVPNRYKNLVEDVLNTIHYSSEQYIGGRMLIITFVGIFSYLAFLILGLPNALLLGLFCGIMDIIPHFGPWIGGAPAFFIALTISPWQAVLVIILLFIVQQLESNLITPIVMGRTLEMHPVTTVLLVLFANELFGILGAIFIIPVYAILKNCIIVIADHYQRSQGKEGFKTDHILKED